MKTIIISLLTVFFLNHAATAQKLATYQVPADVVTAFVGKFPEVSKVTWEGYETEYRANFKLNGMESSANFDPIGKCLRTETGIKTSALPAPVQAAITKDFPGYKINEASKVESLVYGSGFEAEIEKGEETYDVMFTPDGKLFSKMKVDEEKDDKD